MSSRCAVYYASCFLLATTAYADVPPDQALTYMGVTLYGAVDIGGTYQSHGTTTNDYDVGGTSSLLFGTKNANRSTFALSEGGMGPSKLGLKGTESLIDGWSGIFKLETGFNPLSGQLEDGLKAMVQQNGIPLASQTTGWGDSTRAGQIFQGGAYAGVSHSQYGTLTVGRQNALMWDNCIQYDANFANSFSLISFSGSPGGGGDTEDRLFDNSIKYINAYGPIHGGIIYGAPASDEIGAYQFDLGATIGPETMNPLGGGVLSFDAAYSRVRSGVAASPLTTNTTGTLSAAQTAAMAAFGYNESNTLAATVSDNTAVQFVVRYDLGAPKLYAGYEHIDYANPSSPLTSHGIVDGFGGSTDIGGYEILTNNSSFARNKNLNVYWTGIRYNLSADWVTALSYYRENYGSYYAAAPAGTSACKSGRLTRAATCEGSYNNVSLLTDYQITKRFDIYADVTWNEVNGGFAAGYLNTVVFSPTVGMRFSF